MDCGMMYLEGAGTSEVTLSIPRIYGVKPGKYYQLGEVAAEDRIIIKIIKRHPRSKELVNSHYILYNVIPAKKRGSFTFGYRGIASVNKLRGLLEVGE